MKNGTFYLDCQSYNYRFRPGFKQSETTTTRISYNLCFEDIVLDRFEFVTPFSQGSIKTVLAKCFHVKKHSIK